MMKNSKFLAACLMLLPLGASGAIVEGLYEAEIVVPNQSKSVRTQATVRGLAEVFAKVSGNSSVLQVDGVKNATEQAGRYLQQFLYRRPSDVKNADPTAGKRSQILWLRFDEKSVNSILTQNDVPVWGRTRPSTLVWLAVEQDGGRFLLSSASREELVRILRFQAKRQGMALVFPLMDLQDQRLVTYSDVWGGFVEPVLNASKRYQSEAILIGRMSLSRSDIWTARWTLYEGSEPESWDDRDDQGEAIVGRSLAKVNDTLAMRYATVLDDSGSGEVRLAVNGVGNLKQFVKVSDYLQSLQPVTSVLPIRVADNKAHYQVLIKGNPDGLVRIIALGNTLRTESQVQPNPMSPGYEEPEPAGLDSDYTYRLMP